MNVEETLATLPKRPGVYIMKDSSGEIIYIGKASCLKNRVRSYFQSSKNHSPKVKRMVSRIDQIELMVTDSELEALILECNLIKKHRPHYNIKLKDDKNYPYIKVTLAEKYPRVFVTRKVIRDGSRYFGPFSDSGAVRETLKLLKKIFPVRQCSLNLDKVTRERKCLNYHIKRCLGPCTGDVNVAEYRYYIDQIVMFLDGKRDDVAKKIRCDMEKAAEELDFERAAVLRDQLLAVEKIIEKQKVVSDALNDQDVIAVAQDEENACVQIFFIRGGKLLGREHFMLDDSSGEDNRELVSAFVKQYYADASFIPSEILLQCDFDEMNIISSWLQSKRGSKVVLNVPKRGDKKKLVEMVSENALTVLHQMKLAKQLREEKEGGALRELASYLGLESPPNRMECYDISNTQGTEAVGSMVVFEKGVPNRSEYRKFKIKTVEGPNDFAMMAEVLTRRFTRAREQQGTDGKFAKLPDLLIVDGGKGQLSAAGHVMDSLGYSYIPLFGLAKQNEELFTRESSEPILLPNGSESLHLVQRIRDEAHRFAITYHRELRGKRSIKSELSDVEGVGKKRLLALMKEFKSLDGLKAASVEEIAAVDGLNHPVAQKVYDHLHLAENADE